MRDVTAPHTPGSRERGAGSGGSTARKPAPGSPLPAPLFVSSPPATVRESFRVSLSTLCRGGMKGNDGDSSSGGVGD